VHRWGNCFQGKSAVDWLGFNRALDRKEACEMCQLLLDHNWIFRLKHKRIRPNFNEKKWYRVNANAVKLEHLQHEKMKYLKSNESTGTRKVKMKGHRDMKVVAAEALIGGTVGGTVSGVAVGSLAGLIGGPFAVITVPAGALVGGLVGASIGVGAGTMGTVVKLHVQAKREEFDDVPVTSFEVDENELAETEKKLQEIEKKSSKRTT